MRSVVRLALTVLLGATFLVASGATSADAGRYWWVTARVHDTVVVEADGDVWVTITYRCMLPKGNPGSSEVYSELAQHPGRPYEHWDNRIDIGEFSCGGQRTTLEQGYATDDPPNFHAGHATLSLDIRVCTGDVTDDPGKCLTKTITEVVELKRG